MRLSDVTGFGTLFSAGVLFVSCGAPQQVSVPPGAAPPAQGPVSSTLRSGGHGISWMGRGTQQRDLLYVTNANGEVNVYRYWQHTIVGVLANFKQPLGECADWAGHVYIADHQRQRIYEYAHGGTEPLKALDDSPNSPEGCSVDSNTDNVAVANNPDAYYDQGNIAIFIKGRNDRVDAYYGQHHDHFISCAYDSSGNLFTTSKAIRNYQAVTYFYYLSKKGKELVQLSLRAPGQSSDSWTHVDGVAWDGKYWVVESNNTLYRFTINGTTHFVGDIQIFGPNAAEPIAIYRTGPRAPGTEVVAAGGNRNNGRVEYWNYPAGGNPIANIAKDLDAPFGVAISLRTQ